MGRPLLTRHQTAELLSVHITTVRRLEKRGVLTPIMQDGTHWFSRETIGRAIEARQSHIWADVFRKFRDGAQPTAVVIELGVDPALVEHLWASFQGMERRWVVEMPESMRAWQGVYRLGELTPRKLLLALEIVCADPVLRAQLER